MLKSTYKPSAAQQPLPAGWTEHKAPTGHSYYYNATTQQSTYARPVSSPPQSQTQPYPDLLHSTFSPQSNIPQHQPQYSQHLDQNFAFGNGHSLIKGNSTIHHGRQRPQPKDRPRTKHEIPGCKPWILVRTKLGRRFVHNPERNESFWKFPPDVMKAVVEYDRLEREMKLESKESSVLHGKEEEPPNSAADRADITSGPLPLAAQGQQDEPRDESDEYEEVEVTDEEDDEEGVTKRRKTGNEEAEQPIEFNEDDIAYQLAAMGRDYGLDPGEYGSIEGQELEEGAEGLPLSDEDASALFKDMLDDYRINPYNPWEKLIDKVRIVEDDRYTVLPNMKARKEVWDEWSRERIQRLKERREQEEKKDPRIPYFAFLQAKATPKLYWPEFRRKYMKEPEMRNTKVSDKEREKWYREYINRLKLPEHTLKSDVVSMLRSMPLEILNRSTSMAALPPIMLADIRYVSLRPIVRDLLIETHISTLGEAPKRTDLDAEGQEVIARRKQDRERREALAERQKQVQREKRKAKEALEYSKGMMREGEQEVQRAMKVGKGGLLGYMEVDTPHATGSVGEK